MAYHKDPMERARLERTSMGGQSQSYGFTYFGKFLHIVPFSIHSVKNDLVKAKKKTKIKLQFIQKLHSLCISFLVRNFLIRIFSYLGQQIVLHFEYLVYHLM